MKLDFRIDWGYQYLYSRRHYHPFYHWDGRLDCENAVINKTYQLDYPVIWFGPGHCAKETLLDAPVWKSTTRRGLAGVRFEAEAEGNAVFHLKTVTGNFDFSAKDILEKGRIVFDIGPKYLGCHVIVTRTGYYWFNPQPKEGQQIWKADDFVSQLPVRDWARSRGAWLAPGKKVSFEAEIPDSKADFPLQLLHVVCMASPGYTPESEQQYSGHIKVRLSCDGKVLLENTRFYRSHDRFMQILEDLWLNFTAAPGKHTFELENCNTDNAHFLISSMTLQSTDRQHLEFSLPPWVQTNVEEIGKIFAAKPEDVEISYCGKSCKLSLVQGWNEFRFTLEKSGKNIAFTCGKSTGFVKEAYNTPDETPEVTVGYDMTTVPHDVDGYMDWILDYTYRTKLGNIVVFRPHFNDVCEVDQDMLYKWGDFCRTHKIYSESIIYSKSLVEGAGDMMHSMGHHEWPGAVYAMDPQPGWESPDMKTAMEHYLKHLKIEIDAAHEYAERAAFGDASGGHRYCYMAGVDFIRSETMVSHTQHLCSQARPAAEVFKDGEWGVHIAVQHAVQPYFENHLGVYYLSIMQPWMMGAQMIYEEDSLFNMFKEERQAWDDLLVKGKRDMTKEFFKFVKTHPRKGKVIRPIAFVEGRYAAPFNGFICDVEQTPDYSVWGKFGNNDPSWGHNQVEKCRQVLDVLMPGASTQPLRQDFNKRRFFYSGTPYGDFDEVPTEASSDYLKQYNLLLHLGWNTMIDEDYNKLREYVSDGGTLLIGLTQFSTHVKRQFIKDMVDLALYNNGDLTEFCGVKVKGRGEIFSGEWNAPDREKMPDVEISAIPSSSVNEDGECYLADVELNGAEPYIWDAAKRVPLVVRKKYGKGTVYLLTAYAYFGHERLQKIMAILTAHLAEQSLTDCRVIDPSREVFWNVWNEENGVKRIMLLNTDWSTAHNEKVVEVQTPLCSFTTTVRERDASILTVLDHVVIETPLNVHVEVVDQNNIVCHGSENCTAKLRYSDNHAEERPLDFSGDTVCSMQI